jgi:hypothetical protein
VAISTELILNASQRHGTLSLYAALDTQSDKVLGKTAAHHTNQEFVVPHRGGRTGAGAGGPHHSGQYWTICRR